MTEKPGKKVEFILDLRRFHVNLAIAQYDFCALTAIDHMKCSGVDECLTTAHLSSILHRNSHH